MGKGYILRYMGFLPVRLVTEHEQTKENLHAIACAINPANRNRWECLVEIEEKEPDSMMDEMIVHGRLPGIGDFWTRPYLPQKDMVFAVSGPGRQKMNATFSVPNALLCGNDMGFAVRRMFAEICAKADGKDIKKVSPNEILEIPNSVLEQYGITRRDHEPTCLVDIAYTDALLADQDYRNHTHLDNKETEKILAMLDGKKAATNDGVCLKADPYPDGLHPQLRIITHDPHRGKNKDDAHALCIRAELADPSGKVMACAKPSSEPEGDFKIQYGGKEYRFFVSSRRKAMVRDFDGNDIDADLGIS